MNPPRANIALKRDGRYRARPLALRYATQAPMKPHIVNALMWSLITLGLGFVTPSLIIFFLEITVGGINPAASAADIWHRQFAEGHNLFLLAAIGLIPFAVHSIVIFVVARTRTPRQLACIVLGGLIGILALMIPCHASIWYPLYSHGHASSTAVIGFLFIPFYCLITLAIGLFFGRSVCQLPYFSHEKNTA